MISDTDAADRISGKKRAERKKFRSQPGILDWTSRASSRATANWMITATTTKPMVFRNDTRMVGLVAMLVKLSMPTNFGAVMMSHWKNASTVEPMMGRKLKSPSPISVGARKIQISLPFLRDKASRFG
jgi:hypothetical protein